MYFNTRLPLLRLQPFYLYNRIKGLFCKCIRLRLGLWSWEGVYSSYTVCKRLNGLCAESVDLDNICWFCHENIHLGYFYVIHYHKILVKMLGYFFFCKFWAFLGLFFWLLRWIQHLARMTGYISAIQDGPLLPNWLKWDSNGSFFTTKTWQ